jgi:hypothetical protein
MSLDVTVVPEVADDVSESSTRAESHEPVYSSAAIQ